MKLNGYSSSIVFVQIVCIVARRIICKLAAGQQVKAGEIYGLIRFGSRTDVYLPAHAFAANVAPGDSVRGGETVIARAI